MSVVVWAESNLARTITTRGDASDALLRFGQGHRRVLPILAIALGSLLRVKGRAAGEALPWGLLVGTRISSQYLQ